MPIYEYLCQNCGSRFEKRQTITEVPLSKCEECGGKLEKQWSLSGFAFKGDGWYVTDYAAKKGGNAESSTSVGSEEKSSDSKSTTSTESASKPSSGSSSTASGKTDKK